MRDYPSFVHTHHGDSDRELSVVAQDAREVSGEFSRIDKSIYVPCAFSALTVGGISRC